MIFWDTSALVRCYASLEPGHERARNFLLREKPHRASSLILPEIVSAIVRKLGRDKRNRDSLLRIVEDEMNDFDLMAMGDDQIEKANRLIRKHALRAADALHLASALLLARELNKKHMTFLTADAEQAVAAREEGLRVLEL